MKIKLRQLTPNPYRDIGNYPIDKNRVAKLKGSILNTEFWGGLVCRKHLTKKGFYQIAFGHHRIEALKDLEYTEIPMTVLIYTEAQMLQAMAEENREIGQHDIKIMTQTVEQVKKFLDEELRKYKTWEKARINKLINTLFGNAGNFERTKQTGVGQTTILKFLGDTWKQSEIQFALDVLNDKTVDREAIESFKNKYQATEFKAAVKEAKIPIKRQREVAKEIKSKVKGGREIREEVFKHSPLTISKNKKIEPKPLPMLDTVIENIVNKMADLYADLTKVNCHLNSIQSPLLKETFMINGEELLNELKSIFEKEIRNGKKKTKRIDDKNCC